MHLDQPDRQICPHRRPVGGDVRGEQTVDSERCPGRPDRHRDQQHAQRVIEPEDIERRAVHGADQARERHDRRQGRGDAEREHHRRSERDACENSGHAGRACGEVPAPLPRLIVHPPDVLGPLPAVVTEESLGIEPPDKAGPGEQRSGKDPHHRQWQRIGRCEPERIPGIEPVAQPAAAVRWCIGQRHVAHRFAVPAGGTGPVSGCAPANAYVPSGVTVSLPCSAPPCSDRISSSGSGR